MEKERLAEHLERYHLGANSAATSRELELTFGIKGIEVRHLVMRATIAHLTRRIGGIAAAIHGLNRSMDQFNTEQTRLPLDGGDSS